MPDIAVVVVGYHSAATIGACLESILMDPGTRVAVVDNSGDAATQRICAALATGAPDRLSYDDPRENLGYARACNRGIRALGESDYVAIVNPDVRLVRPLSELAGRPELNPGDVIAARLTAPGHPEAVNARPLATPARELGKAVAGTRIYRLGGVAEPDDRVRVVGQLDGALLVLDTPTWRALGGFDESFELYFEDVDLCRRAAENGRCLFLNTVWGEHAAGHSFGRSNGRAFVALRVSRARYARKWWRPRARATLITLGVTAAEFLARSFARCPEGGSVRVHALRRVAAELRSPGSQRVLADEPVVLTEPR